MTPDRPAVPAEALAALSAARDRLGASLVAAWLHGSAVAGGLRPDSDVDVVLVVDPPMSAAARQALLADLMRISGRPGPADPRRPLELVVFDKPDLAVLTYPPRCAFHYGEWLRARFEAGALPRPEANPDFVIVLAQVRQAAVTLAGPPPHALLPEVPRNVLRRAIGDALPRLVADLVGDERNVLLTLARMACTLETGEIVPKDVAAAWAMPRLSTPSADLLDCARRAYLGDVADDWRDLGPQVAALAGALSDRVAALAHSADVRSPAP